MGGPSSNGFLRIEQSQLFHHENLIVTRNIRAARDVFAERMGLLKEHGEKAEYGVPNPYRNLKANDFYVHSLHELAVDSFEVLRDLDPNHSHSEWRLRGRKQSDKERWEELEVLLPRIRGTAAREVVRYMNFARDFSTMCSEEAKGRGRFNPDAPQGESVIAVMDKLIQARVGAGLGLASGTEDAKLKLEDSRVRFSEAQKAVLKIIPLPQPEPKPVPVEAVPNFVFAPRPPSLRQTIIDHLPDVAWKAASCAIGLRVRVRELLRQRGR